MSRCFPFPPPGYMRNGACSEDLIKSIKLQKERDEAKEQQKKDKRKKKEKRKDRKEKEAKAYPCDGKGKNPKLKNVESYQLEKIRAEQSSGCLRKGREDDNEQIERSGITEEHDQPFTSAEPCCLSDSTQSSNKRKRGTSPTTNDHGTTIIIRLPLRKHREHEETHQEYRAGSTVSIETTKSVNEEPRYQFQGLRNSNSEHVKEYQDLVRARVDPCTTSIDNEIQRTASLYNSLFQNWISFPLQCKGFEIEDEDWLSTSKRQEQVRAPKKVKSVNDALRCSSPTLWPRAQCLPEVDIYALPFTVPF